LNSRLNRSTIGLINLLLYLLACTIGFFQSIKEQITEYTGYRRSKISDLIPIDLEVSALILP
jgi:ATP/ADP translocase